VDAVLNTTLSSVFSLVL